MSKERMTCLYCEGPLVYDPLNKGWKHCATCSPKWYAYSIRMGRLLGLERTAHDAVALARTKGRPTIDGIKHR